MPFDKLLYTAKAHTMGGRDNGTSSTDDGRLDNRLASYRRSSWWPGNGRLPSRRTWPSTPK